MSAVRLSRAGLRIHDLPQLDITGLKCSGTGKQIVFPHALKLFIISIFELRPCPLEVVIPCHKCSVIVGAEIVPIFHNKKPLYCFSELCDTGQHAIGENISGDPGIAFEIGGVTTNGMKKKNAIFFQTFPFR